jgi:hypothetical protein
MRQLSKNEQTEINFDERISRDGNRIGAYAKLVEIVEEDIQSRLEKGANLPEPKSDIWFAEVPTT